MSSESEPAFIGEIEKLANAANAKSHLMKSATALFLACDERVAQTNMDAVLSYFKSVTDLIAHIRSQAAEIEKLKAAAVHAEGGASSPPSQLGDPIPMSSLDPLVLSRFNAFCSVRGLTTSEGLELINKVWDAYMTGGSHEPV